MAMVGVGMEVVVGRNAGQSQGGLVACREMPKHFLGATLWRHRLHQTAPPSRCAALGVVESQMVDLPGKGNH